MPFIGLLIAAHSIGTLLVRNPPGQGPLERAAFRLLTGLCACAIIVIVAGSVWSVRSAVILVCAIAGAGLVSIFVSRQFQGHAAAPESRRNPYSRLERLCLWTVGIALSIAAISIFAPPTSWDAVVAHLALPAQYLGLGRIAALEGNTYSGYPHLMHALYTYAYAAGGETGAQFLSWLFAFLGCVFCYGLGGRLGGRTCGLLTAAMFATTPVFFEQAGIVSIDIAVTSVVVATFTALFSWHDEQRRNWLLLAGFLAGSACGIRHTGYIVCCFCFLGILVSSRPFRPSSAVAFGAMALLGAAPWLLRSWLAVGNPVYPFFQEVFPSDILRNEEFTRLGSHASRHGARFYEVLWFPWRIVVEPGRFDGWNASPGGLVLALGIPGLFAGGRRARILGLYCLAGVVFFFFFQHFARYMLPFFVVMMPVAALAVCRFTRLRWLTYSVTIATFASGLVLGFGMNHFKIPVAVGLESRETYLDKRVERYAAFQWVNRELPEMARSTIETPLRSQDPQLRGLRMVPVEISPQMRREALKQTLGQVFTLDPRAYYLEVPSFQSYEALEPLMGCPLEAQLRWFADRNIHYLLYPVQYVEGTPHFRTSGLLALFNEWRSNPDVLKPVKRLRVTSRNGEEEVIVYELRLP